MARKFTLQAPKLMCRITSGYPAAALSLAALIGAAGCTRTQHFRVLDADTGRPLQGVRVQRHSRSTEILAAARQEEVEVGATGADGILTIEGLEAHGMAHQFVFDKAGYRQASAEVGPGLWPDVFLASPRQGAGQGATLRASGVVTVPLHPDPRGADEKGTSVR